MLIQLGFAYFATVIILCALMVVASKNPVHSALFMLPLFFHVAGVFVMLNAEFLAAVQVLVYAGAILVLFLFVIMLLNVRQEEKRSRFQAKWAVTLPVGLTLGGFLMTILVRSSFTGKQGVDTIEAVKQLGNSQAIGMALYTEYLFPFEIASIILLVAMVGAIVLAKKKL